VELGGVVAVRRGERRAVTSGVPGWSCSKSRRRGGEGIEKNGGRWSGCGAHRGGRGGRGFWLQNRRGGQWTSSGMRTASCALEWSALRGKEKAMVAPWRRC
jgi:hypothetical protein